ncbi:hypothetical protein A2962_05185 [Candidatus Woesebacteria bacterium RIFCSPLOWO2_01_FULL_39_61]|uniref:GH26 domain-containing protein n=1 Tax=Candidatus Woesebacteria bacterium RIFCSPHIGHO2_02_FULL_39_13 TaxID=1802505 RepID=A0A1F7Z2K9_9BACT|nr:MAG: hypothetical protein A3D01_01675 [Candidatus Woesebacteria bacterium RIFCSPHIGHO2_02_FULL_39_13]OGM39116.1 MAG: hypothetical protein A3E13_01735 [Candidatus Woesebacteria bacterium RIFCSPHIGHO2_12_FULL_40_20]OGM68691.1 MAG: hypothetical protein A2962_05185 [Candidatus Woesebacteria bacterium RIFCSPLOWO2_01_FULL_39_61]OGM74685.1 MAG: hypothetical protein A3H19_05380 [Candidatus Woesebacteria bacterium RIFCSPLOWO2_12_FULL_39_9]
MTAVKKNPPIILFIVGSCLLLLYVLKKNPPKSIISKYRNDQVSENVVQQDDINQNQSNVLSEEKEAALITPSPKRKVPLGVVVNDYSNKNGEISELEKELGIKISTIGIYKQFGLDYNKDLNEADLAFIKTNAKTLLLTWEPWNPKEGMNQSVDYLKEINDGKLDSYLSNFAQQVKGYSSPVILRFAHEMNGNWYPWGNRPLEYKEAYRKVVDTFRKEGAANVRFMWSINHESVPPEAISNSSKYYPGDSYVDIIGLDGFNFGSSKGSSNWKSFPELFSSSYNFVTTRYPSKPVMISEVASTELGGNKSAWVNDMFTRLAVVPKVSEIIWFNLIKETDWRIDSSQSSLQSFKKNL